MSKKKVLGFMAVLPSWDGHRNRDDSIAIGETPRQAHNLMRKFYYENRAEWDDITWKEAMEYHDFYILVLLGGDAYTDGYGQTFVPDELWDWDSKVAPKSFTSDRLPNPNSKLTTLKFWAIENPAKGFLYQFLGRPVATYQPYEYGDDYRKQTALWGNFNIPPKLPPLLQKCSKPKFDKLLTKEIHYEGNEHLTRKERRSICSPAFAQAFFKSNR
jgi:hypothetical protein